MDFSKLKQALEVATPEQRLALETSISFMVNLITNDKSVS